MISFLQECVSDSDDLVASYRKQAEVGLATKQAGIYADMNSGLSSALSESQSKSVAEEQYRHFEGWAYVAIRAIAERCASQSLCCCQLPMKSNTSLGGMLVGKSADGRQLVKTADAPNWMKRGVRSHGEYMEAEILDSHPLLDAVADPNEVMTQWSLVYVTVASMKLTGASYWWFEDANDGMKIWPLPVSWVDVAYATDGSVEKYYVKAGGDESDRVPVSPEDMAYFYLPDPSNPAAAKSPLQTQSRAVAADEAIQDAQYRAFKNGIFPGVVMTVGRLPDMAGMGPGERPVLTMAQRKQITNAAKLFYQGTRNYNEPLVVDGMIESVSKFSNSPAEMDFLASGEAVKKRIFQAYGVNPLILGENTAASYAESAMAEKHFVSTVVNPMLDLMGQVITGWLGTRFGSRRVKAYFVPAQAEDTKQTLENWKVAIQAQSVSLNEIRVGLLGLSRCPDPDADMPLLLIGGSGQAESPSSMESVLQQFMAPVDEESGKSVCEIH